MDSLIYYGLTCVRETRQGRYLLMDRKPEPLSVDELSVLDVRMLQRNAIPHLLPLVVEEIDCQVRLRYHLPAARSLEQAAMACQGDLKRILELLHSIVIVLEDSRLYMLDETKYALHPSLIWVGNDSSDVSVAYLPLCTLPGKPSVRQELLQLALSMLEWAKIPTDACLVLLDCLKSALFELAEFRQLLIGLQTNSGNAELCADKASYVGRPDLDNDSPKNGSQQAFFSPPEQNDSWGEQLLNDGDTLRFNHVKLAASPAFCQRALLIVLLFVWGAAAWKSTKEMVYIAAGLSVISLILYFRWRGKSRQQEEEDMPEPAQPPEAHATLRQELAEPSRLEAPDADFRQEPPQSLRQRSFHWTEERQRLYADNPAPTVVLSSPAETVFLTPETELLLPRALLEICAEGNVRTLELVKDRVVFGRSPEETDWVLEEPGVSRVHGEILRQGQEWSLQDLGSRNGSRLNGERLAPKRPYTLKDGDRIAAAEAEFIFRVQ